jgi:hypothetical protein
MNSKYHTRRGYEQLLLNILDQKGSSWRPDVKHFSDYHLLKTINTELIQANCESFSEEELEMELH